MIERNKFQDLVTSSLGDLFLSLYHHYSESLFLEAASLLTDGYFAVDAGSYFGDNAFKMAANVGKGEVWTFEPDPRLWTKVETRIQGQSKTG